MSIILDSNQPAAAGSTAFITALSQYSFSVPVFENLLHPLFKKHPPFNRSSSSSSTCAAAASFLSCTLHLHIAQRLQNWLSSSQLSVPPALFMSTYLATNLATALSGPSAAIAAGRIQEGNFTGLV